MVGERERNGDSKGCCRVSGGARETPSLHHFRSVTAPAFVLNKVTKVWLRTSLPDVPNQTSFGDMNYL